MLHNKKLKFKPLLVMSIAMIVFGLFQLYFQQKKENDFINGKIVEVEIVEKPNDCESINTKNTFIKIYYNGKYYNKKIGLGFCEELKRKFIKVKLTPDEKDLFFLNDWDFISSQKYFISIIILIGVTFLIKSYK